MTAANFSVEFQLNISEIRKLNKMYFKHLYKERIVVSLLIILMFVISIDFILENDFLQWIIKSLVLIVLFVLIHFSCMDMIALLVLKLTKKLLGSAKFQNKYKLYFTYSDICITSPLGELNHKWTKIEKVISTKNFLFLYIKERNTYIISISKKNYNHLQMEELLTFVEKNIMAITKV